MCCAQWMLKQISVAVLRVYSREISSKFEGRRRSLPHGFVVLINQQRSNPFEKIRHFPANCKVIEEREKKECSRANKRLSHESTRERIAGKKGKQEWAQLREGHSVKDAYSISKQARKERRLALRICSNVTARLVGDALSSIFVVDNTQL